MMPSPTSNPRRNFLKSMGFAGSGLALGSTAQGSPSPSADIISQNTARATEFGIVGDGRVKNTDSIARLIHRLAKAGGGTLYFPPGNYLTGPIHFCSNLTLCLEAGATLRFSDDFDDYLPMVQSRWQGRGVTNFSPLLYARNVENIAIIGRGTLNGSGAAWWDYVIRTRKEARRPGGTTPSSKWQEMARRLNGQQVESYGFMRPSLFQTMNCRNIHVQGVSFRDSPFWTTHFVESENIVVDGISIYTPNSPNTDGINPESSRFVRISNCYIHTDDDCITIKSGKDAWARQNASPSEDISITNCVMTSGAAGVGIGSEMSGGVRRVAVSNCVIKGTGHGIHIKSIRGRGGVIEDISFSNLILSDIVKHPAIHLNLQYWKPTKPAPLREDTPTIRNIHFNDIRGSGLNRGMVITGLEENPIENVSFSNIDLECEEGISVRLARDLRFSNLHLSTERGPAVSCENVKRLEVDGFQRNGGDKATPAIDLRSVRDAAFSRCLPFERSGHLASVSGKGSTGIIFSGIQKDRHENSITRSSNLPENAVEWVP